MGTKTKTFDCVEFERRSQERLMAEYEARKDECSSEIDFLTAKAEDSEIPKAVRAKIAREDGSIAPRPCRTLLPFSVCSVTSVAMRLPFP